MLIVFEQTDGRKIALPIANCAFQENLPNGMNVEKETIAIYHTNYFYLKGSLEDILTIIQRAVMMSQPQLQVPSFKSV